MWSITFILLPKIENKIDSMTPVTSTGETNEPVIEEVLSQEQQEKINNQEIVRNKIETIRKRLALKWLIIEWDSYYREWQLTLALKKYLDFYKKNSEDILIIEKLWDTYFEMKKFSSAYNYYSKIIEPTEEMKEKTANTLVLTSKPWNIVSIKETQRTLQDIWLSQEALFYYSTSLSCSNDFHGCKKDFWNYFWPEKVEGSETWSWSVQEPTITHKKLSRIKESIINYKNFQVDDVYLKDAYIIGTWYTNGFYNLSSYMWEQLLEEKKDYKPILKIIAQSYFELWEHEESREVLWEYYEIDDKDAPVSYLLGVVNSKLREYVLANIYFNKAIDLWYQDKSEIYRQLIHNFYILENDSSMLESFTDLIENNNFTQHDLSLWIYYHIIHEEYDKALEWSQKWKELFSQESVNFHTYEWWILTERWEYENAQIILKQWFEIEPENPFLLINFGYNALARWEKWEALIYFKKILSITPNSEFASTAEEEISKLSTNK
jgi:tetratricopeptide (TPR) repeat protein